MGAEPADLPYVDSVRNRQSGSERESHKSLRLLFDLFPFELFLELESNQSDVRISYNFILTSEMAAKAIKGKSTKAKSISSCNSMNKEFMKKCIEHIAEKIVASKANPDGRTPRGFAETMLQEGRKCFPTMNMNMINYAVKKLKDKGKKPLNSTVTIGLQTSISSLTGDSSSNLNAAFHPTNALLMLQQSSTMDTTSTESDAPTTRYNGATAEALVSDAPTNHNGAAATAEASIAVLDFVTNLQSKEPVKSIGRPKGTTAAAAVLLKQQTELATKEAADWLANIYKKSKSKKRLTKGLLSEAIEAAKIKHFLPEDTTICTGTIRQRVKRNSNSGHVGQTSPMVQVEPYLVELIIKLAEMRYPITTSQGLQLANSLIKGKTIQKQKIEWKTHNCRAFKSAEGKIELGEGYWRSF